MVKLTVELIEQAAQYTNPVRDRELDLRGYKIPVIENLGATLSGTIITKGLETSLRQARNESETNAVAMTLVAMDQFDTLELSDNEVRKVDGFPLLKRLKCLILNNNRITRIGEHLEQNLPNLDTLILTGNNIQELGDIDVLSSVTTLRTLSLMRNPVSTRKHYRSYVIHKLPNLVLLDFQKIKLREREASQVMFKGKQGQQLAREIGKRVKTFVPGAPVGDKATAAAAAGSAPAQAASAAVAKQNIEAIKAAIAAATTLEEVERLNRLLQSGQIPGRDDSKTTQNGVATARPAAMTQQDVEEDEDMES